MSSPSPETNVVTALSKTARNVTAVAALVVQETRAAIPRLANSIREQSVIRAMRAVAHASASLHLLVPSVELQQANVILKKYVLGLMLHARQIKLKRTVLRVAMVSNAPVDSVHLETSSARLSWEVILPETIRIHATHSPAQSHVRALISDEMSVTVYNRTSWMERRVVEVDTATMVSAVVHQWEVKLAVGSMITKRLSSH